MTALRRLVTLALAIACVPGAAAAQMRAGAGAIVERCGAAAGLQLGAQGSSGSVGGDGLVSVTAEGGVIREITVRRAGAFTQRYIVIGQSTLGEVLQRYGQPTSSRPVGPTLQIDYGYDGITFLFPYGGSSAALQNDLVVRGATVHPKARRPDGSIYPCATAAK